MSIMFIKKHRNIIKAIIIIGLSVFFIISGITLFWISTFRVPTSESIRERRVAESTKIFDRTGEILLHDTGGNTRRSIVPLEDISRHIKNATIAIEDREFYDHIGVKPRAFLRALFVNILTLNFSQGGSTITQQVVKNSILTNEKAISRKIKEWVIAIKLEQMVTKDEILSMYLNEIPYGGVIYGVEEASQAFFGKSAKDVSLAEAAYLAAIPKAPTFFSPYGKNRDRLEERKNLVLQEMLQNNFINKEEYEEAKNEEVKFLERESVGIKAPHFVFYVLEEIKRRYGENSVINGGLRVITTLDYSLQSIAEEIVLDYATRNSQNFDAENAAMIAIDPKSGDILMMVGSRNYFDKEIDGAFNVITAKRQPGSAFKPFVYAKAFMKGYTPETVIFDVKTQFSTTCAPNNLTMGNGCYSPENYDGKFRGPISLRNALAQSLNVPSVKVLYLAGLNESIQLARDMGIQSLTNRGDYGLTLVLGGGEVTPLEITSAYGVFANNGIRSNTGAILEIRNRNGDILEKREVTTNNILPKDIALKISDILSDNTARAPIFGQNSALHFANRDVAVKTGTTNDYRDAWIVGYTPDISVGAWVGNNDNSPMEKRVAGMIVAPMWREFMNQALTKTPVNYFEDPLVTETTNKPVLHGIWQGGKFEGNYVTGGVHSILKWVNRDDPRGAFPENPSADPQFERWEYSTRLWAEQNGFLSENPVPLNQFNLR